VTYSSNRTPGQWAAHGRYLARESATQSASSTTGAGFEQRNEVQDIDATLGAWQKAGDPRLFKLIISPEFGDRLDLETLTRNLMARMEVDVGSALQWVATGHRNTEYPHVHVALRGVTDDGQPLRLARDYIQHGIRKIAEDFATAQLGYRTELDAREAQRREIHQKRYTSLDRILNRSNGASNEQARPELYVFDLKERHSPSEKQCLNARLLFLQSMGLAKPIGGERWRIRSDFETVLRAMQRTADRQRALAAHGAVLSDTRLPTKVTDIRSVHNLAGRVLGHSEDESNGRSYMLLEGTDHQVHFIYHSPRMEAARREGKMRANSFVRFRQQSVGRKTVLSIQDLGSAEKLLANKQHLRSTARALIRRGVIPTESGLAGWLGKYEAALAQTANEIQKERTRATAVGSARDGGRQ
jgi:type IV secretory pathway VirD2 relaxase